MHVLLHYFMPIARLVGRQVTIKRKSLEGDGGDGTYEEEDEDEWAYQVQHVHIHTGLPDAPRSIAAPSIPTSI
jgi:hypothetical protein